jgi:hypothetical protein
VGAVDRGRPPETPNAAGTAADDQIRMRTSGIPRRACARERILVIRTSSVTAWAIDAKQAVPEFAV